MVSSVLTIVFCVCSQTPGLVYRQTENRNWVKNLGWEGWLVKNTTSLTVQQWGRDLQERRVHKHCVLGLVTSKTGALENKDDLRRRVDEASKFAPLEQLCLSPQCGFASTEEGNTLAEQEQWNKLRMIVELASEIWGTA